MEISDIKKQLSIVQVLAHYNIKVDRHNQINCPFHADDKPSCKIYPDTNTYHCFGCGKTGDVIQFIQDKEKTTKHEALKMATELASPVGEIKANTAQKKTAQQNTDFTTLYEGFLKSIDKSGNAQKYCKERGLDYKALGIGYNSGKKWNKLKHCIIFPLKDQNGNTTSLYGRRITETNGYNLEYGKHYYSENRKGLYPNYPDSETEILIITEAIIDAATLIESPIPTLPPDGGEGVSVLACYGTNGMTTEHVKAIKQWASNREGLEIIFFFDGDEAGRDGIEKSIEKLKDLKCSFSKVETPEGEDINSLYVNYGQEAIIQLIDERKKAPLNLPQGETLGQCKLQQPEIIETVSKEVVPKTPPLGGGREGLLHELNKIIFCTDTARYIIKGTLCKQLDKMLVSLDVQHLETGIKYRCRLDLYEEKQSRREAREAAEKLDLRSDLIENDLSYLTDLLEEHRENELKIENGELKNETDKLPGLAEQSKCKTFLKQQNLIDKLNDLIGQSGIVGEENNRLFLFVIASSHKMPDTLHALIQGSSGSGKTHLLSKIAALMPPERVVKFTRVTENSFYNYDEFFFRNKLVCLEDIDGLKEEALFAWRELISNNQLSSSTSQKDENGNIRSAQRIVRGPMASMCATTHGQIYEDNMSRLFIIAVDESGEQTGKIMDYQKQKAAGLIDGAKEKEATEFLQNLIRMLKPMKVVNPFARQIQLPEKAHKIRRLNELYLAFVNQITIVNQYRRKRTANNTIVTEIEDLRIANEIMFDSIFLKVDELDGSLRQFYEKLKGYIKTKPNPEQYQFMQREIRHALNISKSQLQRYVNDLVDLEYISTSGGYQNRGYKYKILWWDDIAKLRDEVKEYLKNQIDKLEKQ